MKLTLFVFLCSAATMMCEVAVAQSGPTSQEPLTESEVFAEPIPPEVVASAVAAVAKLGDEVVLGRYQVAVDRMNPMWKERAAKRMGDMDALKKQLDGVAAQMVQQGISMISFKPQGNARAYEVSPGMRKVNINGVATEKLAYTKWLVLVPTATQFRVFRKGDPKPIVIDSISFQVAISDKGKNDWTFIDGAGLNTSDLRGLFITLPLDLQLPPVEKHEAR